jgi:hypothetical protein
MAEPETAFFESPEAFEAWLEEWWKMMGAVPRSRYLEVLERCETLRRRLEEAEATISRLRGMLEEGRQEEARKVLDLGEQMLEETLKAQAEWTRAWAAGFGRAAQSGERGGEA